MSPIEVGPWVNDEQRQAIKERLAAHSVDEPVHVIFIGTKPDIIKQQPVYAELVARGHQVLLCHSGQHTDYEYSGGMLLEFGMSVDIHLLMADEVSLGARVATLVGTASEIFATAQGLGHTLVPYIHGDTATSMGVAVAAYLNRIACVHVEAGIRTMTPKRDFVIGHYEAFTKGEFDWPTYLAAHRLPETYESGSREPFPEQFNTRVSDAGSGLHAAAVDLDRDFLLGEGFRSDSIVVVGNTVADITRATRDRADAKIFDRFPHLLSGEFVRICIHRRENTSDRERFLCYFDAMEQLVRNGRSVLWVELKGTEWAVETYGLVPRLDALLAEFPDSFIRSKVWAEYTDVIAAFLKCSVLVTDSGSIQEEANVLGIPCVTLRFGTDRGESLLAGGNVLAPPLSAAFVAHVIECAIADRDSLKAEAIYGTDVAAALIDEVDKRLRLGTGLFRSEEEILRLPGTLSDWPDPTDHRDDDLTCPDGDELS